MRKTDFGSEVAEREAGGMTSSDSRTEEIDVVRLSRDKKSCPSKMKDFCFTNMDWLTRISVEPALLFVMISMGLTNGVSIQYVQHRIYENYHINETGGGPCSNDTDENKTAAELNALAELNGFNLISGFAGGLPALFVTLIVSAASDTIGRKIPLVLPVVGMFCGTCVFILVSSLNLSIIILLVSNVVLSFTGGYPLFFSGCSSYIADTTAKEERTYLFALLFTLSLVGSGVAGIGAGYWIQGGDFTDPFWLAAAMQLLIVLYLSFWIPETVKSKAPSQGTTATSSKMSSVLKGITGILSVAEKGRRVWLLLALSVLFISLAVFGAINSVLFVRLLNKPFCWSSVLIGYFNASKPFINGLGLTLGARFLTKCLKDYAVIQLGLLSTIAMLVIICISTETYVMFLGTVHLNIIRLTISILVSSLKVTFVFLNIWKCNKSSMKAISQTRRKSNSYDN